jgi:hypothetical protein
MKPQQEFPSTARNLLVREGAGKVYEAFEAACQFLGFREDIKYIFDIGLNAYGLLSRGYHGQDHGQTMTLITDHEIETLRSSAGLSEQEVNRVAAILTLAGWYHDVAYIQVDNGLEPNIAAILKNYVTISETFPFVTTINGADDLPPHAKMVCDVFGFKPGQLISALPTGTMAGGMNEFLSALVAAHCLTQSKNYEAQKHTIAAVTAVIESTIPFRTSKAPEALFERLKGLGFSEREAEITLKASILLANRDVDGFCGGPLTSNRSAEERFKYFVAGTWQLLPENNIKLRDGKYTPSEFCRALEGNLGFISRVLVPENIFHDFRGFPAASELAIRRQFARDNLELLKDYMTAKIAAASIVETIAMNLDPNGGIVLTDLVDGNSKPQFAITQEKHFEGTDRIVYNTLVNRGDAPPYGWDIKSSPISAFLMQSIGKKGLAQIVEMAGKHIRTSPADYPTFLREVHSAFPDPVMQIFSYMDDVQQATQMQALKAYQGAVGRVAVLKNLRAHL